MGYSVSIHVTSKELKRSTLKFLKNNMRFWYQVSGVGTRESGSAGPPVAGLSYGGSRKSIGFDYQSTLHGWEREYTFCVTRWLSIKAGDRTTVIKEEGEKDQIFLEPIPYVIYDYQKSPVILATRAVATKLPESLRWAAIDKFGMKTGPESMTNYVFNSEKLFEDGVHQKISKATLKRIGKCPEKGDRMEWGLKYRKICLEFVGDEIKENIKIIRKEIMRLDRLWAAYSS